MTVLLTALWGSAAHAHLIVAQRGTLNFVNNGAFMVLSLPVSAFNGLDDDRDGLVSTAELQKHTAGLEAQVQAGVSLSSEQGPAPLQGLMFNLVPPDHQTDAPARQVAVMGRFALHTQRANWRFKLTLFGNTDAEKTEHITVTRGRDTQLLTLTPEQPDSALLPSMWTVLANQVWWGATHVLSGADHLVFLLLVLASGWAWRHTLLTLTSFTLGHAVTLFASGAWGWSVSPSLVEPMIAATIVGMFAYDRWASRRSPQPPAYLRYALVWLFALVHGLGLSDSFRDLGLGDPQRLISLAGFNLGIELGQLAVALLTLGCEQILTRFVSPLWRTRSGNCASYIAASMGIYWVMQRVLPPG